MTKPKLLCNCIHIPEKYGAVWIDETRMYPTDSLDGETCKYCTYTAYKDYGDSYLLAEKENDLRRQLERKLYEKPNKVKISDWHKIDKKLSKR